MVSPKGRNFAKYGHTDGESEALIYLFSSLAIIKPRYLKLIESKQKAFL